jgi:thiamine pyrophosphate-dependent acetolactate synthase large subunit-like protein
MGDANMGLTTHYDALAPGRVVHVRHEAFAVAAAEGYARATGDVGVATVSMGPALTNCATALVTAARSREAVVIITGSPPTGLQAMDQARFTKACEAQWIECESVSDVADGFWLARSERSPVVLSVPLAKSPDQVENDLYRSRQVDRRAMVIPKPDDVDRATSWLASVQRPIVVVGRGALGALADVERLASLIGAPIATTLRVKGALASSPLCIGTAGGYSTPEAIRAFKAADGVLAIGASLGSHTTDQGCLFPDASVAHIDLDPGRLTSVDLPIQASAEEALPTLVEQVVALGIARRPWFSIKQESAIDIDLEAHRPTIEHGRIDPRLLIRSLDSCLPDDAVVVADLGHFHGFVCSFLGSSRDRRFDVCPGFSSIGLGLPTAIGLATAQPERPVVLFTGDGGLMQSLTALDTVTRYSLRLFIVVVNDGALGAEYQKLRAYRMEPSGSVWEPPDFAAIANVVGIEGERIFAAEDVRSHVAAFAETLAPRLIDCQVSRQVMNAMYRRHLLGDESGDRDAGNPLATTVSNS